MNAGPSRLTRTRSVSLRTVHKYLSLTVAALWLLQAATGLLNVFHREIDDWMLGAVPTPLEVDALGRSVQQLQLARPQATVSSIFAGGGTPGQYDVFVTDDARGTHVVRMDGSGKVLRERPWAHDFDQTGFLHLARMFHETFLIEERGLWFVGLSGLLLLSNVVLALKIAWPRRGQWRRVLLPRTAGALAARLYAWHRAAGLGLAALALIFIGAGTLVAFADPLEGWLGAGNPAPQVMGQSRATASAASAASAAKWARAGIAPAQAMRTALARYRGSTIALVSLPSAESPWYRVRLLLPDDTRRVFGTTAVFVAADSGAVLADYDARRDSLTTRFVNAWYATHTGEIAGLGGRIAALVVAAWLLTMIGLGLAMWWARRRQRRAPIAAATLVTSASTERQETWS